MNTINVTICYPYKLPHGEGIYSNPGIPMTMQRMKQIADNAGNIDFNGVNTVSIMLEKQGDDHGRIIQYSGYTNERGMFTELVN